MIINTIDGIVKRLNKKSRRIFDIEKSKSDVIELIGKNLPNVDEVFKIISLTGGIASISFIKAVASKEVIEELSASTLRICRKQFYYLADISRSERLKKATFFIGSIMQQDSKKVEKYDYFDEFIEFSTKHNWHTFITNNHSKIILMRTENNYYVLETSSNLNENPKIEQYSFENDKELYNFYYDFFEACKRVKNGQRKTNKK